MSDLLEQLRHYGEAVEQEAVRVAEAEPAVDVRWWHRRPLVLLAAALVAAVVGAGGVALRLALADERVKVVATVPRTPAATDPTVPPLDTPPTTAGDAEATTTTTSEPATTTTAGARPQTGAAPLRATTTTAAPAGSGGPAPTTPTTTAGASPTPTTTSTPTTAPKFTSVRGTATWTGGRDSRATLRVGACPVGNTETACGSAWRVADVGPDGSFELLLPTDGSPRDWNVAALVSHGQYDCAFNCYWRTSQAGRPTTISDGSPPSTLELSVAARVVDVFVRDRNNRPFAGGGVFVRDIRCPERPCPSDQAPMYSQASSTDGAARIIVDPALTYDLFGMAQNTGWPNPKYTNPDGSTSWHSPEIRRKGSEITEGYVFLVDGAPA